MVKRSVYDLRFDVLDPRAFFPKNVSVCEDSFGLWRDQWSQTFVELGLESELPSNDFLDRQVSGLFEGDRPVGLLLYGWYDLRRGSHLKHAYFKGFPQMVLDEVRAQDHSHVMTISYLTLAAGWRRHVTDVPLSDVLIACSVKMFQQSHASALLGYYRNDRKVNEMVYRHGGRPILADAVAYGVKVDYAVITKDEAHESTVTGVRDAAATLWNRWQTPQDVRISA